MRGKNHLLLKEIKAATKITTPIVIVANQPNSVISTPPKPTSPIRSVDANILKDKIKRAKEYLTEQDKYNFKISKK